ncbi:high choriolytic enzyme 1-like [Tubulanus polymorphus]|uniref:high choriolytic enzyme 1-like n=1 Tax=Tubulanus polymorphus TaxID=672921 RepID=UPI003DA699E0
MTLNVLCLVSVLLVTVISQELTEDEFEKYKAENPEEFSGGFEGDIILNGNFRNALRGAKLWPGGNVIYDVSKMNFLLRWKIRRALSYLEKAIGTDCIRFVPRTNEQNYISVYSGSGCSSFVGMVGGAQRLSLNSWGCFREHTMQHEFLHAMGFKHEQTRSDRDDFIVVHFENIEPANIYNFHKADTNNLGTGYNYPSIMHYGKYAFSKNRKPTIIPKYPEIVGRNSGIKKGSLDAKRVRLLYGCDPPLPKCKDLLEKCPTLASQCGTNTLAIKYCKKTCGKC